jgi:hypothetical protein
MIRDSVHLLDLSFDDGQILRGEFGAQKFPDWLAPLRVSVEDRLGWHPSLRAGRRRSLPTWLSSSLQEAG